MSGRQSFNRGLTIMKLLAENGSMSASAIARELCLNQSSVSRLLQSLIQAGFVCKPSFQKFQLDYGVLTFAGIALENFPLTSAAASCCNILHERTKLGAVVTLLNDDHLLYMARIHDAADASLSLVDNIYFPIHLSSPGLALAYAEGEERFKKLVSASISKHEDFSYKEDELFDLVNNSFNHCGFLYLKDFDGNKMKAATLFKYHDRVAALSVYSSSRNITISECRKILDDGVELLGGEYFYVS